MTLVNPSQVSPNDDITSSSVNTPINQLAAVINGNLDDTNISAFNGAKITPGTVTPTSLSTASFTPSSSSGFTGEIKANGKARWTRRFTFTGVTLAAGSDNVVATGVAFPNSKTRDDIRISATVYTTSGGAYAATTLGVRLNSSSLDVGIRNSSAGSVTWSGGIDVIIDEI